VVVLLLLLAELAGLALSAKETMAEIAGTRLAVVAVRELPGALALLWALAAMAAMACNHPSTALPLTTLAVGVVVAIQFRAQEASAAAVMARPMVMVTTVSMASAVGAAVSAIHLAASAWAATVARAS
jgi:hypothetical protein